MNRMDFTEFIKTLEAKLNGRGYKGKRWGNYPNSIFYYYDNDNEMQHEIAIYTNETTYGIYI